MVRRLVCKFEIEVPKRPAEREFSVGSQSEANHDTNTLSNRDFSLSETSRSAKLEWRAGSSTGSDDSRERALQV